MRVLVLVALGCALAVTALADSTKVPLSAVPTSAQSVIHTQVGDGTMGDIFQETQDEDVVYDVALTDKAGADRDFTVAQDGTLLSVEVPLAEAPAAVKAVIESELSGGSLTSIDKNLADSEITFDVEGTAKDGTNRDFTVSDDGDILSRGVTLDQTPGAVQTAIAAQLNGATVASIDENFDDDTTNFDVTVTSSSGAPASFNVSADGSLVSKQVSLSAVPPPVRRAIHEKLQYGTVLRVDKSYVKKMGVFPFHVEGRVDGKPFDFDVGPRGRFLGMD
jgi:hypothetical protein